MFSFLESYSPLYPITYYLTTTQISGYLGNSDAFAQAIALFAESYADQTERDHAALLAAIKEGRLQAVVDV